MADRVACWQRFVCFGHSSDWAETMRVATLLILLVGSGEILPAQEGLLPTWANVQERSPVKWPDTLNGLVLNEAKQPIANAKVVVSIEVQLYPPGGGVVDEPVYRRELRTGADGMWSVATTEFPRLAHRPLVVVVTASAADLVPWRTWDWNGYTTTNIKGQQQTITLQGGYEISGVCVDEHGAPAKGVRFRLSHANAGIKGAWGLRWYDCTERGEFRVRLPKSGDKVFWIFGESLSPAYKVAPKQATNDIRYELKSGARVMGFVRDADGKPAADVIVQGVSKFTGNIRAYSIPFEPAARTDQQGRFRFPPLNGEYKFRLTSAGHLLDGTYFATPDPVPAMLPVMRKLESGREALILRASKVAVVSGIARWPDKSPAVDTMIAAYAMPKGNGSGLSLGRQMTGKDGRYSFRIPVPLEQFLISADHRSRNGKHFKPTPKSNLKAFDCDGDSAMTKLLETGATVDFDFVEY